MTDLHLHIVSPEGTLADVRVRAVYLPGAEAPFEVLPGHAGIISPLLAGEVRYATEEGMQMLAIRGGFVRVADDQVELAVEA